MFERIKEKLMEIDKEYIVIGVILVTILTYIIITGKADKKTYKKSKNKQRLKKKKSKKKLSKKYMYILMEW